MELPEVTYATKCYNKDYLNVLDRHREAELVIGNNLGFRFVDIGDTGEPYYIPEVAAIKHCDTKYILWYAGDVVPPQTDWVHEAIPLLEEYPIITCLESIARAPKHTDGNFETFHFSDQCYIAKTEFMRQIDYNLEDPIANDYPFHGGNSFERRVAQYLKVKGTPLLCLTNHRYRHIRSEEK